MSPSGKNFRVCLYQNIFPSVRPSFWLSVATIIIINNINYNNVSIIDNIVFFDNKSVADLFFLNFIFTIIFNMFKRITFIDNTHLFHPLPDILTLDSSNSAANQLWEKASEDVLGQTGNFYPIKDNFHRLCHICGGFQFRQAQIVIVWQRVNARFTCPFHS